MASTKAVTAIVDQMLGFCRRYDDTQRTASISLYANVFANTPTDELAAAATAWIEALTDEDARYGRTLPPPRDLNRIMTGGAKAPDRAPAPEWVPASSAFKDAHLRGARRINELLGSTVASVDVALAADPPPPHRHKSPTIDTDTGEVILFGNEECPRCAYDTEAGNTAAKARRQAEEIVAALPVGREGSRSCRCDGSGIVDTAESMDALRSLDYLDRFTFPCPVCNRDAYERWHGGQPSLVKG